MVRPRVVLDVSRIAALKTISASKIISRHPDSFVSCRPTAMSFRLIARQCRCWRWRSLVGHFQTRNRGQNACGARSAHVPIRVPKFRCLCDPLRKPFGWQSAGCAIAGLPARISSRAALTTQRQPEINRRCAEWPAFRPPDAGCCLRRDCPRHSISPLCRRGLCLRLSSKARLLAFLCFASRKPPVASNTEGFIGRPLAGFCTAVAALPPLVWRRCRIHSASADSRIALTQGASNGLHRSAQPRRTPPGPSAMTTVITAAGPARPQLTETVTASAAPAKPSRACC